MIFVACKRFAESLIRQACHDSFEKSEQLFPGSLLVRDIYDTIVKHDKFDFLTNRYMAVSEDGEDNDVEHS
jgi:hypothetical protein